MLTQEEKETLLSLTRTYLRDTLIHGQKEPIRSTLNGLQRSGGVFVTLIKQGQLRGCIGRLNSEKPIYSCVQELVLSAALNDSRFTPVSIEELESLSIEISLLSPFEKVLDQESIHIGTHGLYFLYQNYSGLLLPQVAIKQGWDVDAFLSQITRKAGVPSISWSQGDLFIFTAEIIKE